MSTVFPAEAPPQGAAALAAPMLRVRENGQPVRRAPLDAGKTTIGSSPQCKICLPGADVRPLQCLVNLEADAATITRWAAGVLLNGSDFRTAPLRAGDRLSVGRWEIEVESLAGAAQAPVAQPSEMPLITPRRTTSATPVLPTPAARAKPAEPVVTPPPTFGLTPAAAANYAFTDRIVLGLWQSQQHARSRTRDLLAAVRGARSQVLAIAADLAVAQQDLAEARDTAKLAAERSARARTVLADARKTKPVDAGPSPQERAAEARAAELAQRVASVEQELEAARAELAIRTDELTRLSADLTAEIAERTRLNKVVDDDKSARSALETALAARDGRIAEQQSRLSEQEGRLAEQENRLAESGRILGDLNKAVDESKSARGTVETELATRDQQLADEQRRLAEQESLLAEQVRRLGEQDSRVAEQDNRLAESGRLLEERDAQLAESARESAAQAERLAELERGVAERQQLLSESAADLAALTAELDAVKAELAESREATRRVTDELASQQAAAQRLADELAENREASRKLAEELAARIAAPAPPADAPAPIAESKPEPAPEQAQEPAPAPEPPAPVWATQPIESFKLPAKDTAARSLRASWPTPIEPAAVAPAAAETPAEAMPADAIPGEGTPAEQPPVARFWSAADFPAATADSTPPRDADPTWSWGADVPAVWTPADPHAKDASDPADAETFALVPPAAWGSGIAATPDEQPLGDVRSTWSLPTLTMPTRSTDSAPIEAPATPEATAFPTFPTPVEAPTEAAIEHAEDHLSEALATVEPIADAAVWGQPAESAELPGVPNETSLEVSKVADPEPPEPVSFIERYRHLVEEQGGTPPTSQAPLAAVLDDEFQPARRPSDSPKVHEDSDEALDDYMARMMARIRGDESRELDGSQTPASGVQRATSAPRIDPVRAAAVASIDQAEFGAASPAADSDLDKEPFQFEPIKRTGRQPGPTHLADLRAIANQTAISAIAVHRDRRHVEVAYSRVVLCGISSVAATFLMQDAPGWTDWKLWAGIASAIVGCWSAWQLIRVARRRTADRSEFLSAGKLRTPANAPVVSSVEATSDATTA